MTFYIIKLIIMLPLCGVLIYGSLWLYRKYQPKMMMRQNANMLNIVETLPLGVQSKLAVVDFEGRRILVAITRGSITQIDVQNAD